MTAFTESVVEDAALGWLESINWQIKNGAEIAPDAPHGRAHDYGQVVLAQRLRDALARLNPTLPVEALDDAFRKLTRPEGAESVARNRAMHRLLVNSVTVEYRTHEGEIRGAQARVIDFDHVENNDWLAVNQFIVVENKHSRRPDIVLFVNGLPSAVLELKNAADEGATIWSAFQQLQTYKARDPHAVRHERVAGHLRRRRSARRHAHRGPRMVQAVATIAGEAWADAHLPELQVVIEGVFDSVALPRFGSRLHRVRGRGRRTSRKEDGGLPPVPCGATSRSPKRCARRELQIAQGSAPTEGRYERAASPAVSQAIAASVWCGTRKARARA